MNFNEHSELIGKHAILGASQYAWLNYDPKCLKEKLRRKFAPAIGTVLHQMAAEEFIKPGIYIRRKDRKFVKEYLIKNDIPKFAVNINLYFDNFYHYVNDAVSFDMEPEVVLSYSEYSFGTADAIRFQNDELYIFDLKTGFGKASVKQLYIYMALFCLEYGVRPEDIYMEARIYQTDLFLTEEPDPRDIRDIMNTIVAFNNRISRMEAKL